MNKILKGITLSMLAVAGLASCSSDSFDYTPADVPTGAQVYFPTGTVTSFTITEDANSFSIPLNRANVAGALDVPLSVTITENNNIYTVSNSVSFNDGDSTAVIVVNYDPAKIEYGVYDTLTIAINDPEMTTPYGIAEINVVAGATAWVDYGTALYREDVVSTWYSLGNPTYPVKIERNIVKPGMYRLVDPYGAALATALGEDEEEWADYYDYDGGPYYIEIDASDPDWVYVKTAATGLTLDPESGMISTSSYVDFYLSGGNYSLEDLKALVPQYFGKLEDGVISMPTQTVLISEENYNDGGWYLANSNGLFAVALPGYTFADYSIELSYAGTFTDTNNNVFAVGNLTLGADATDVKAVVVYASDDAAAVADAIAAGDLEATSIKAGRIEVPIAEGMSGKLQIVVVVLDGNNVKASDAVVFEYYGGGVNPWKSLGTGYLMDNMVITMYAMDNAGMVGFDPQTYAVEIEENTENPGLYRLVNAFEGATDYLPFYYTPTNVEVNATDPAGVYITAQSTGLDDTEGEISIATYGGYMLQRYDFELLKDYGYFGKLVDGVITFPHFAYPDVETMEFTYQGLFIQGSSAYYAGYDGDFTVVLPGAAKSAIAKARAQSKANDFARRLNAHKVAAKKYAPQHLQKSPVKKIKANL